MKYTDKARSKEFGFVIFMEHMCNNTINSREKAVQKRAVILKQRTEFAGNGKDTVAMQASDDTQEVFRGNDET